MYLIFLMKPKNKVLTDFSDNEGYVPPASSSTPASITDSHQQALNYSTLAATAAVVVANGVTSSVEGQDQSLSSTETLLRNIQNLLRVAADNARQQERQTTYEKG